MTINKDQKVQLVAEYLEQIKSAKNIVVVQQSWVVVNVMNKMRSSLESTWADYRVVRKRLFLRAIKESWVQDVGIGDLAGSVAILFSKDEDGSSLKIVNDMIKEIKKDKKSEAVVVYMWWWFDGDWKSGEYVTELANVPSKEELLSKLVYLLNYPVQSFAATLKQIADKVWEWKASELVVNKD